MVQASSEQAVRSIRRVVRTRRARGWALNLASAMVDSGVEGYVAMGERTISNLLSDTL